MKRILLFSLLTCLISVSCSEYSKVVKSTDLEYKYTRAVGYYESGECFKAMPIFDELLTLTRGTQRAEDVFYYNAKTYFCVGDYYMANYFFKQFAKTFSTTTRAEECLFLAALCSSRLSSESSLDQTDTKVALDEFQLFIDSYPNSSLRDSCNNMMQRLNEKLEVKSYDIARMYEQKEKYKSASIALKGFLIEYPESRFREEAMYLIIKSDYEYAENSVDTRKLERFRAVIESYLTFATLFPQSKMLKQAENYYLRSRKQVERLTSGEMQ